MAPSPWPPHLSHIPDTLYMVDQGAAGGVFREGPCPCRLLLAPSGGDRGGGPAASAGSLPDPTLPVLSEELLRQMRQREQELRGGASRAYSLGANRWAISQQLQLRVVREAGLPDQAAALLARAAAPDECAPAPDHPLDLMVGRTPSLGAALPGARPNLVLAPPSRAPPRRLAPPTELRLHRQPHLGRHALRLSELQSEGHLSKMIPDIAMATATLEHLELAESDKDDYGSCEADDLSPVHMLV